MAKDGKKILLQKILAQEDGKKEKQRYCKNIILISVLKILLLTTTVRKKFGILSSVAVFLFIMGAKIARFMKILKKQFLDYTEFRDSNELFEYVEKMSIDEFNQRLNLCIQTFNKTYEKVKQMNRKKQVVKNIVQKFKEIIQGLLIKYQSTCQ